MYELLRWSRLAMFSSFGQIGMKLFFRSLCLMLLLSPLAEAKLTDFVTLGKDVPPGNVAVGPDGRVFISVHEFYGLPLKVVEVMSDGSTRPYPNADWSDAGQQRPFALHGVLGLNVDRQGILWLLDGASADRAGRLVGWNTRTETLERVIYLAKPVAIDGSFLNDLAIDRSHNKIYVADTASPGNSAIVVVDLNTGQARRVLHGHPMLQAEDIDMVIDSKVVTLGGAPARIGVNPITLSPDDQYLYFGSMSGTKVYRIATEDLNNSALSNDALATKIAVYGDKPISDGITVDTQGNVYVTAITDNAIGVVGKDGKYRTLYQSDDISWPDGFAVGPDNRIYVTINQLHRSPVLNGGKDDSGDTYRIAVFEALAEAVSGR